VKGAFTGASSDKVGLFEAAHGGTIFLDEIGSMPLSIQAKFLRVLQDKQIRRVGGTTTHKVDVRVVVATNEPLEKKIEEGNFREDLYYRISVIPITIDPLRKRREDILPMMAYFIERERGKENQPRLDANAQRALMLYDWPGNVRELENAMHHALAFSKDNVITFEVLPERIQRAAERAASGSGIKGEGDGFRGQSLKSFLRKKEQDYVNMVIKNMGGDKEKAARALNVSLATLYRKIS
jgi:transcriptional regulator with PAS, ATPase and Fis domain